MNKFDFDNFRKLWVKPKHLIHWLRSIFLKFHSGYDIFICFARKVSNLSLRRNSPHFFSRTCIYVRGSQRSNPSKMRIWIPEYSPAKLWRRFAVDRSLCLFTSFWMWAMFRETARLKRIVHFGNFWTRFGIWELFFYLMYLIYG